MVVDIIDNNSHYWTLTPANTSNVFRVSSNSMGGYDKTTSSNGFRPAMNLKSNVVITGGKGTKKEPFQIALK